MLKILGALSRRMEVSFFGEDLRRPAIQPSRRRFRLFSCATGHVASLKALIISAFVDRVCSAHELLIRRSGFFEKANIGERERSQNDINDDSS